MKFGKPLDEGPFTRITACEHIHAQLDKRIEPIIMPRDLRTVNKMGDIRKNDLLLISSERRLPEEENIKDPELLARSEIFIAYVDQIETGSKFNKIEILISSEEATEND